jgi:hypothetical protein
MAVFTSIRYQANLEREFCCGGVFSDLFLPSGKGADPSWDGSVEAS